MLKIKFFLPSLLLIFLLNSTTAWAQEVPFAPPEVGNMQVQKATGAAFKEGWNFFTLGFGGCTVRIVLNELQADGGSALKAETLFSKELLGWQSYSILNADSEKKKIGGGDLLAFYSNQKFFFETDQKACSNPDKERQKQIDRIGEGSAAKGSFTDKVRELPIDMWTKLMEVLNSNGSSTSKSPTSEGKQIFENLTIGGKTVVDDLGITGKISSGLLSINGLDNSESNSATINTLSGDLFLQNLEVGGVNFLSGKVVIDKNGNLKIQNTLTVKKYNVDTSDLTSSSLGKAILPVGQTSIIINTTSVANNSAIFVTSETVVDVPLAVSQKISGQSFKVEISKPAATDIKFNWFIIN